MLLFPYSPIGPLGFVVCIMMNSGAGGLGMDAVAKGESYHCAFLAFFLLWFYLKWWL